MQNNLVQFSPSQHVAYIIFFLTHKFNLCPMTSESPISFRLCSLYFPKFPTLQCQLCYVNIKETSSMMLTLRLLVYLFTLCTINYQCYYFLQRLWNFEEKIISTNYRYFFSIRRYIHVSNCFFLKLNLPIHSKLFDEYANSKCSITFMKRRQFLFTHKHPKHTSIIRYHLS